MRTLIILLLCTSIACASTPRILVDKDTKQIVSWGYTEFTPTSDQIVIDGVMLGNRSIEDGLIYDGGKVKNAPQLKAEKHTYRSGILKALGLTEDDVQKIKALP